MPPSTPSAQAAAVPAELTLGTHTVSDGEKHTYGQILKSSALIGGSSMVTVAVSIARVKVLALLLGPAGVGLVGLYSSILDLAQSVAGMGVNSSGVRQIAEATATGDTLRIGRTAAVLRRTSIVLGLIGAIALVSLSGTISGWTFNSDRHALPIALLALAVLFRTIGDGQGAVIQGMRRIGDLARISVVAAAFGTTAGVAMVCFKREAGIAPMLVSVAVASFTVSWWYRRKIVLPPISLRASQVWEEAVPLLTLGFAFMTSAMLTAGVSYVIRAILAGRDGLEVAGLYQSAWALGGLHIGFILQAMGTDFYPRLTAVADDHQACNRLVNEQALIGSLLAGPGVLATLTFAPTVIQIFYSTRFHEAVGPLRWICLGMALRVLAWPLGYIILAKNAQRLFLGTELAASVVHVALAYALIPFFGVSGATMAFFGLYVWHLSLVYVIARRLTGFRWSQDNIQAALVFIPLTLIIFCALAFMPSYIAVPAGALAALAGGIYSLRSISRLLSMDQLPAVVRTIVAFARR